jgi:hypothetical protein
MALAANCFLKYLWWTACYSAWSGIPKLANQWRAAGTRASINGWSVIVLEFVSVAILFTILRRRSFEKSGFLTNAPPLIFASILAIAGTALFALALTWFKQNPLD